MPLIPFICFGTFRRFTGDLTGKPSLGTTKVAIVDIQEKNKKSRVEH
jgi:hypothetical protein